MHSIVCILIYTYTHVYICAHIFIHSSVSGHLGCFHILAFEIHCYEYWGACMFLNYGFAPIYAQEWNSGSYDKAILVFWGTAILSSTVATPIYILINCVQVFLVFPHSLFNTYCFLSTWPLIWGIWGLSGKLGLSSEMFFKFLSFKSDRLLVDGWGEKW